FSMEIYDQLELALLNKNLDLFFKIMEQISEEELIFRYDKMIKRYKEHIKSYTISDDVWNAIDFHINRLTFNVECDFNQIDFWEAVENSDKEDRIKEIMMLLFKPQLPKDYSQRFMNILKKK
ncbi:hypothetical protein RBH29_17785, partial [Herbivorax sp. ANBcel31]|uniref:hypothetical protein n=1 Tax=Herbivorax sp. ANBcel31 TaxID=3069754 RepID=UPI0027B469B1